MKIITCEQVSNGHPDKICDQIADAIVTDCLKHDRNSRVAIECLFKNRCLVIAGELTSTHEPDYNTLVQQVFDRINNGGAENADAGLDYKLDITADDLDISVLVDRQSSDIALGVNSGGAGDQGMCYGYATNETPEMLPIPFVLATKFLELLKVYSCRMLKSDAKAQVSYDYDGGKITTFLCSVQHMPDVEVEDFRPIIEKLMVRTATAYGLNTDFEKQVNPTGRFVLGSSFADCGVTGRKLACDTYGGIGHIGGGAMSGKDPSKVDRSGAYAARKIARDIVSAGYADRAEVQIAYAIGIAEPVSVYVETFGTEHQDKEFITQYVRENYDLTPRGIIENLGLLDVNYGSSIINWTEKIKPWYNRRKEKKVVNKMAGKTKNYTDEFKKQIVMIVKSGKSSNAVAKEYGISKSSVTKWVRGFNNSGSFKAKDNRTPEENEIIELRKRVKELEMEADILKQAALIMARKSK